MKILFEYFRKNNGASRDESESLSVDNIDSEKYIETVENLVEATKKGTLNWIKLNKNKYFLKTGPNENEQFLMELERTKINVGYSFHYMLKDKKTHKILLDLSTLQYPVTTPCFETLFSEIEQNLNKKNLNLLNDIINDLK